MKNFFTVLGIIILAISFSHAKAAGYDPEIYRAQQELTKQDYFDGAIDGIYGRKTRRALKSYQRANNLRKTGKLDAETKALLLFNSENWERGEIDDRKLSRRWTRGGENTNGALSSKGKTRDPYRIDNEIDMPVVNKDSHKIALAHKKALVIGINAYPTMPIEAAVADAKAVSKRLEELNFEVTTLIDDEADLKKIKSELDKLARTTKDAQVLIYFAGHGVNERLHDGKLEGYILPIDANLKELYATAISMEELRDLTRLIPAKHVLYAFDSCYSGLGLTRAATAHSPEYLTTLAGKRAVYMITAGKKDETVREVGGHGIFTLHFLDGIAGAADTNPKDNVVQASELGVYLANAVSKDTENEQNPQHGLLEGDGDFLFPLQDDDPIRLRESQLAELEHQTLVLTKRINSQEKLYEIQKQFIDDDNKRENELAKKLAALDKQIKAKKAEIARLSQRDGQISAAELNRSPYSVMRFLNTGVDFNILKTFPNLEEAEEYYSKVFGIKVDLDNGGYYQNLERKLLLSRKPISLSLSSGLINKVYIETETISDVLTNIKYIDSELHNNHTTFVKSISLTIGDIADKRLTFEQFQEPLIARYRKPTSINETGRGLIDWKTGKRKQHPLHIWSDKEVLLSLEPGKSDIPTYTPPYYYSPYYSSPRRKYTAFSTSNDLVIRLHNKSSELILKSFYEQAKKIAEVEELIIEKNAIMEIMDHNF